MVHSLNVLDDILSGGGVAVQGDSVELDVSKFQSNKSPRSISTRRLANASGGATHPTIVVSTTLVQELLHNLKRVVGGGEDGRDQVVTLLAPRSDLRVPHGDSLANAHARLAVNIEPLQKQQPQVSLERKKKTIRLASRARRDSVSFSTHSFIPIR